MDNSARRVEDYLTDVEFPFSGYGSSRGAPSNTSVIYSSHHNQPFHPAGSPSSSDVSESRSSVFSASPYGIPPSIACCSSTETLNQQIVEQFGYDLPCEFGFAGCVVRFVARPLEVWISHSISHFGDAPLPSSTICTFCDRRFNARHNDTRGRLRNWRKRMAHVAEHFQGLQTQDQQRPDFALIDHMKRYSLISKEDHKKATKYSELSHGCSDIVPRKPRGMRALEDKVLPVIIDSRDGNRNVREDGDQSTHRAHRSHRSHGPHRRS